MNNTKVDNTKMPVSFFALDSYVQKNIVLPTERELTVKNRVEWGEGNSYPEYLLGLFNSVPTLRSIINGNVDFITGDEVTVLPLQAAFTEGQMNLKGDTIREQIKNIAQDLGIYGGFTLQVIRDFTGKPCEVYYIDMRFMRTNKDGSVFYYCEDWTKPGTKDVIVYPAFMPSLDWPKLNDEERNRHASSILYVKNTHTQVYPAPAYAAAVKACEIERHIDDFHISSLENQFVSSAIINFNNGVPDDATKEELEKNVTEKFCGASNGGRIMLSWNPNKESATDIVEFKVEDFGERYKALATHARQQIFGAFRAIPLLFGLTSEANTGFSTDEFEQSFKLYNRTQIQPSQRMICDAYDKIYGQKGVVTITPFSLAGSTEDKVN